MNLILKSQNFGGGGIYLKTCHMTPIELGEAEEEAFYQ